MYSIDKMKPIRCFIFDLDGTLVFNEHANAEAYRAAFETLGLEMSAEEYGTYFGLGVADMLAEYTGKHGIENTPELLKKLKETKAREYAARMHLIEQNHTTIGLLRALAPHYHIALATTAREVNARAVLEAFNLIDLFDFMVFGEDVARMKPDPECHHLIAKHFNVEPSECIIFEDSNTGLRAAEAFGAHICKIVQ
jgi:HAD superfamily hydrolase (TIGR01509 family)